MLTNTTIPKGYEQTDVGVIPEDWEVKEAKTIEEARAYAGKDYKGEIHYGDVIHVDTSAQPNWISDNWYRIITGTAVVVGIYAALHK